VALAVGAGLHIGQDDLPLDTARRLLGNEAVIGVSCTTPDEARIAVQGGADYLGIGPCYDTPSKIDLKTTIGPRGCARVLDAVNDSPVPTVVIGGVQLHNVERILHGCVSAGGKPITGVAVVSAIVCAENPRKAAELLVAAVRRHHSRVSSYIKRLWEAGEAEGMLAMIWRTTVQEGGVIQNVTNTVVQNDCANVCLALKCSPISRCSVAPGSPNLTSLPVSSEASEAADLSKILGALVVNLGTLNGKQIEGMIATGELSRVPLIHLTDTAIQQYVPTKMASRWSSTPSALAPQNCGKRRPRDS
jgi:thiamine-phosphate diphosphorylase/hydroxyethylthiazole kinase